MRIRPVAVAWAPTDRILDVGVALLLVGGLLLPFGMTRAATGDPVLLNEMLVSHAGADTAEFLELYGTPGSALAGLSLVVVEGDSSAAGTIDLRVDFAADDRLGGNGFFLVGNPAGLGAFYGVVPDVELSPVAPAELFENGSQTVALVVTASVGAVGTQVTGGEVVLDAVGLQDPGFSETFFWGAPVFGPVDGFLPSGARRATDGLDTDTAADWLDADHDLGAANTPMPATAWDQPLPEPPADVPSADALQELLDALVANGSVHPGKAEQLRGHLDRAAAFAARAKVAAAVAQLRAFANQAQGLAPRWLSWAAADELAAHADAVAGQLTD